MTNIQKKSTTEIKKRKSTLFNYKVDGEIFIPYTQDGIQTENRKVLEIKRSLNAFSFVLIVTQVGYNFYELYTHGFDYFDMYDWMTFIPDILELGFIVGLLNIARRVNKKSFLFNFFGLTNDEIQINLFFKKHRIKIKDVISYRFFTSQYNVNYLIFELKDGKEHKIKWLQTFLIKEQQEVVNDYFDEIDKRIHLPHRNS
ncbi:hypothetical protein KMW28_08500 [Flammeovirga yaeyamensis]|uniref:DUF304 domain-containing protein n=1 Tax=Flammeovirga yaeyamensis TaxID=367791 RepID=A0AAX1NBZ5_9BACT|nr:hypothetical protein [Flammeovirga yaeyamensis]MBB3698999.1 hypothetical protein [Flammeovirga yaeyamensis]NMF36433.1 hypothetical protein [Flammeovirga yaeyamensis]QWG03607.1 hypothetical protein KMW28_08500 [Flammeovirga yaeyamensis]